MMLKHCLRKGVCSGLCYSCTSSENASSYLKAVESVLGSLQISDTLTVRPFQAICSSG